jgi:hypothetical protein
LAKQRKQSELVKDITDAVTNKIEEGIAVLTNKIAQNLKVASNVEA